MSITNELREWAFVEVPYNYRHKLLAIADRIDTEHEKAINGMWEDAKFHLSDESLTEHGWVRLPKDANGEYIHIGDVLKPPKGCNDYVPLRVTCLIYDGYEKEWFFDGEASGLIGKCMDVAGWTHYYAPTVEDMLQELVVD